MLGKKHVGETGTFMQFYYNSIKNNRREPQFSLILIILLAIFRRGPALKHYVGFVLFVWHLKNARIFDTIIFIS